MRIQPSKINHDTAITNFRYYRHKIVPNLNRWQHLKPSWLAEPEKIWSPWSGGEQLLEAKQDALRVSITKAIAGELISSVMASRHTSTFCDYLY